MEGDVDVTTLTQNAVAFQSTPSAWKQHNNAICSHSDFNPLPPHGGRRIIPLDRLEQRKISIHSLRMEGDALNFGLGCDVVDISIHSLRMEGDLRCLSFSSQARNFNPLPPHGGRLN